MPGSIRSMHVEHVFRDVQTDRGSLLHGRLLWWQFDTVTLAHRCRRGASTPSPIADIRRESPNAGRVCCLLLILIGVIGLKLFSGPRPAENAEPNLSTIC